MVYGLSRIVEDRPIIAVLLVRNGAEENYG
jgi:hypothetical protein